MALHTPHALDADSKRGEALRARPQGAEHLPGRSLETHAKQQPSAARWQLSAMCHVVAVAWLRGRML